MKRTRETMEECDIKMEVEVEGEADSEQEAPIEAVPSHEVVLKWLVLFQQGKLNCSHFRDYWRVWVPEAFHCEQVLPELSPWQAKVEERAQKFLLNTLEEFMCNGDKNEISKYMTNAENPPSVCGKVFKLGEPTYNCRECGMDATCVLCVECFKESEHKNHRYKMGTSSGGGCCDCGDLEAWKQSPCCNIHYAGLNNKNNGVDVKFPTDLVSRTEILFRCILKYAYQLLTLEYSPGLPSDLRAVKSTDPDNILNMIEADHYCTVLYNDETHTFEQVIDTLARVIKCSQRDAIEFVTDIDREGRTVVQSSTFQHCSDLKSEIEKFTSKHGGRPLKVLVVHANVIAHQIFALKLLEWLQKITSYSEGFRNIFTRVSLLSTPDDASIVEGILQKDSNLWKSARLHWHRLFIAGMFMEYESKKSFAKFFTKFYGSVMKDFIRDDHDHSFSIASLSVQIFTVPTLSQYLIACEDVLFILMNTFVSECSRKCNKFGKLEFDRTIPNASFKRASYILYDLNYLLASVPEVWTNELRKGFLQGLSLVLTLLTYMQGMDSVTRQTGQHMEYEPEWESAFNLHLKLAPVITLLLKWCASDKIVLVKAYRLTLNKLYENPSFDKNLQGQVRELVDHSASCIQYDVATQPVSIHLPLSRFLAGLHLSLEKFNLTFDSSEFSSINKQTPEQILEPVLRTQVMIAQVHAGMWRRNGYSLANQIYFYHNVKCRGEMLDKDIVLLQMCASLIESNEFLIHLINKFSLLNWASQEFDKSSSKPPEDESTKQTINLVEEFLSLLIIIIGERYVPGVGKVTADDCIKNEIIHQLCIKPLSHSEVNKALAEDINHETGMERVIDEVAVFKKPSQNSTKAVYELKQDYLNRYNVFFYHYTKEELSKSEEEQRKLRKTVNGFNCCPPPVLPKLCEPFSMVANLLQCDVMLFLMHTVLERSLNLHCRSYSEAQLQKTLHLIGYALHEEEQNYTSYFTFTKRAQKWDIIGSLEELCSSARVEAYKPLAKWTYNKFKQLTKSSDSKMEVAEQENEVNPEVEEKEFRAKLAANRRAAIMAQMTKMQQNFIKDNAELFQDVSEDKSKEQGASEMVPQFEEIESPIALGPNQTRKVIVERKVTCILCQEDQVISLDGPAMVLAAFVQKSTVLCRTRGGNIAWDESSLYLNSNMGPAPHTSTCGHVMHAACWKKYVETIQSKENRRPYRLRQATSFDIEKHEYLCPLCECLNNTVLPIIPPLDTLRNGKPNDSRPGVPFKAWFAATLIALKQRRENELLQANDVFEAEDPAVSTSILICDSPSPPPIEPIIIIDPDSPVVEPIVIEIHSDDSSEEESESEDDDDDDDDDEDVIVQNCITRPQIAICEIDKQHVELKMYSVQGEGHDQYRRLLSNDILTMINLFCQVAYTKGLDVDPHEDNPSVPMMAWKSCAYTIHSIEWLLRYTGKSLLGDFTCRQQDGLENLVRLAGVLGISWKLKSAINQHGFTLLTMLLDSNFNDPSILEFDCFGVLVPLTATFTTVFNPEPAPPPLGTTLLDLNTLYLMLGAQIAQIILTTDITVGQEEDVTDQETECLTGIVKTFKNVSRINTVRVWEIIKHNSLPFLRCCAIFYHFLTSVPAPQALKEVNGDTFENICSYLGLPYTCNELLEPFISTKIFYLWGNNRRLSRVRDFTGTYREMRPLNELIPLPDDYSDLINNVSTFLCPNSEREDSRNPTMCLVCGETLCSQTYCCQTELNKILVGACTYHAHQCGAGAGIFLRVRECEVVLLASPNRGCFRASPYVDDYGEADQGLRRGNPLHLCKESYRKLQILWLSHSIHEEIARAIEFAHTLLPTQWQHL